MIPANSNNADSAATNDGAADGKLAMVVAHRRVPAAGGYPNSMR
jgi:hypothetical protein